MVEYKKEISVGVSASATTDAVVKRGDERWTY